MHVDEFIERYSPLSSLPAGDREAERYARFVLALLRMPAALVEDFRKFIPQLYCTYEGKRWRVVHASPHGYVGLNPSLVVHRPEVYARADPMECSDWRKFD